MKQNPQPMTLPCRYDETSLPGRDFTNREVVEAYDAYHRRLRDIDGENRDIIATIGLRATDALADFGCGTGALALTAARQCAQVHAIDISQAMVDYTAWKAREQGVTNIACHCAGFLTYVHEGALLDVITSTMALHHLPDFWKQEALCRLSKMLKPGGCLFLGDVVFQAENYAANIANWIRKMAAQTGPDIEADLRHHISAEYSTFTWIMEGLLERAGLRIEQAEHTDGVLARYLCIKCGEPTGC